MIWRLLGVRVGKRVFDDGCSLTERTLTTIGDDCVLNAGSEIQCHSQEDGAFKSDSSALGAGCTLGVHALVHYGVTMGDGSVLAPDSFLMKGEEVPAARAVGRKPGTGDVKVTAIGLNETTTTGDAGREFWRRVLLAGGFTAIPRWTLDPVVGGWLEHEEAIPEALAGALHRMVDELRVPFSSVVLMAHAKVLAALSGEREVATGYAAVEGGRPLPCRLTVGPGSWRSLLLDAHRIESELLAYKDFAVRVSWV